MSRETAFVAFGSNDGNRVELCDRAISLLGLLPHSQVTGVSSLYETEPIVDPRTNPGTQWFLNGVVRLETELPARRLLEICREIERALGRDRDRREGPRTMDLDLLFYGAHRIEESGLTVPHPRLHQRRFVLQPLAELDPDWRHPVLDKPVRVLLDDLRDTSVVRPLDPQPASRYGTRPACRPLSDP